LAQFLIGQVGQLGQQLRDEEEQAEGEPLSAVGVIAVEQGQRPPGQGVFRAIQIVPLGGGIGSGHRRVQPVLDQEVDEAVHQVLDPGAPSAYRGRFVKQRLQPLDAGLHGRVQDVALGPEVVVDGGLGQPHLVGDHLQRGGVVSEVGEQPLRGLQDLLPGPFGLRGAAGHAPGRHRHR
jgi:hypothetical protein